MAAWARCGGLYGDLGSLPGETYAYRYTPEVGMQRRRRRLLIRPGRERRSRLTVHGLLLNLA